MLFRVPGCSNASSVLSDCPTLVKSGSLRVLCCLSRLHEARRLRSKSGLLPLVRQALPKGGSHSKWLETKQCNRSESDGKKRCMPPSSEHESHTAAEAVCCLSANQLRMPNSDSLALRSGGVTVRKSAGAYARELDALRRPRPRSIVDTARPIQASKCLKSVCRMFPRPPSACDNRQKAVQDAPASSIESLSFALLYSTFRTSALLRLLGLLGMNMSPVYGLTNEFELTLSIMHLTAKQL